MSQEQEQPSSSAEQMRELGRIFRDLQETFRRDQERRLPMPRTMETTRQKDERKK